MTSSTGRPSRPPLALMSSRHISRAILITLLGAAPAPVKARLSPILIGGPLCANALDDVAIPNTSTAATARTACWHQTHMALLPRHMAGRRREAADATHICLAAPRATCLFFESASRSKSCLEHDLFRKPASTFRDHALILRNLLHDVVAHPTQAFDLRLHHVAGSQERVGALADAAAGATAEHVAALEGQHIRGVLDLLLGGEDELRGIAVLLDGAVDGEADGQIHMH